jgi:hypothetical protein
MDHKEYFLSCIQRWGSNWRQEAWKFAHSRQGLYPAMCNGAVDGNPFRSDSEYEPEDLAEIYAKVMRNLDYAKSCLNWLMDNYELVITDNDRMVDGAITTAEGEDGDEKMQLRICGTYVAD